MRTPWIIWGFILFCFLTGKAANAGVSEPQLVERFSSGTIDWRKGVVEAKGTSIQPKKVRDSQQGRSKAVKDARSAASDNLFNTLQKIRIHTDTKIYDVTANNEEIANRLKTMAKEAVVSHQKFLSGGTVEVTLRMSIYGGFAQLMLPPEIKQIESVRPISTGKAADKTSETSSSPDKNDRNAVPKSYTGMVVDARGTGLAPALAPRIVDENGDEVFGAAFASREFAVLSGMVGYASDMTKALKNPRVANHPMTLKGLDTKGIGNCEIMVSISDANRLRSNFNHLSFLKKCRVMIVLDPIGK